MVMLVAVLAWSALASAAPKRVGNVDPGEPEVPAEKDASEEEGENPSDELIQDEDKVGEEKDKKAGSAKKPAGTATKPEEPPAAEEEEAGAAKPVPQKPKEKKGKDYVRRADQNRNNKGIYQFESGAYKITTDVNKDLANVIAAHMDRVYKEYFSRFRNFRPNPFAAVKPNEKMPLYVLTKYEDYVALMRRFGFNVENSGGVFFRGRAGSGLATWVEGQTRFKMFNVLQHEGFHQFANARLMGGIQLADGTVMELPPWVNEGLAEYFGDAIMVKGELKIGMLDRQRLKRMKQGIKEEVVLPFRELMTMTNEEWVNRVTQGDQRASLMYDNVWSICYFLIEGGKNNKKQQAAFERYLFKLNNDFVIDPNRDRRGEAFNTIFGNKLENFEKAWRIGVNRMEPDAWYSSVRHLEWMAAALEAFHKQGIEVKSWPHLKEQLIRHEFKALIRERDIVARGERKEAVEDEEQDLNFPDPAQVEFLKSTDPKLPHGLLITHIEPNILLTWSINENGVLEQDISYLDPPRGQIQKTRTKKKPAAPVAKKPGPAAASPNVKAAAPGGKKPPSSKAKPAADPDGGKPRRKGTIRVGS